MALAGHPRAMKMAYFHTRAPRAPVRPAVMKRAGRNAADGVYFQAREGLFCPVKWPLKGANYHPKNRARKRFLGTLDEAKCAACTAVARG